MLTFPSAYSLLTMLTHSEESRRVAEKNVERVVFLVDCYASNCMLQFVSQLEVLAMLR